jgi:hypothetical protein
VTRCSACPVCRLTSWVTQQVLGLAARSVIVRGRVLVAGPCVPAASLLAAGTERALEHPPSASTRVSGCPLCRLASWVARQIHGPVARPVVPPEPLIEDVLRSWSAVRIGEFMHQADSADLLPGVDRGQVLELLADALRAKETVT